MSTMGTVTLTKTWNLIAQATDDTSMYRLVRCEPQTVAIEPQGDDQVTWTFEGTVIFPENQAGTNGTVTRVLTRKELTVLHDSGTPTSDGGVVALEPPF